LGRPWLEKAGIPCGDDSQLAPILALVKEKVKLLTELPDWVGFFFTEEYPFQPDAEEEIRTPGARVRVRQLAEACGAVTKWDAATLEATLKALATAQRVKAAEFVHPAR